MKITTRLELDQHLKQLGIKAGRNLVVHGRLISFGRCLAEDVLDTLQSGIGPDATLVVPTYVFGAEEPYDPIRTKPTGMGALSELVWRSSNSVRSFNPVHSHCGLGPLAKELLSTSILSSFGEDTDFAWMLDHDFDLLLLGCGFSQGGTFLHHLEKLIDVPYRASVPSPKQIVINETIEEIPFRYFARQDDKVQENFDCILPALQGHYQIAAAPYGNSILISLKTLARVGLSLLRNNPYFLVDVHNS